MQMSIAMPLKMSLRTIVAEKNLDRARAGLPPMTQTEIAAGSGVHQSVISKLLAGKSDRFELSTIDGLCTYLHISPNDLFGYTPD